jgi:hypothetical protein
MTPEPLSRSVVRDTHTLGKFPVTDDSLKEIPRVNLDPRMAKLAGGVHRFNGQLMGVLDVDRVLEMAPKSTLAA